MEKIFDQEYLDRIHAVGPDLHRVLKSFKELVYFCSRLEAKIDELKQEKK